MSLELAIAIFEGSLFYEFFLTSHPSLTTPKKNFLLKHGQILIWS